jgi:hypothetical protein
MDKNKIGTINRKIIVLEELSIDEQRLIFETTQKIIMKSIEALEDDNVKTEDMSQKTIDQVEALIKKSSQKIKDKMKVLNIPRIILWNFAKGKFEISWKRAIFNVMSEFIRTRDTKNVFKITPLRMVPMVTKDELFHEIHCDDVRLYLEGLEDLGDKINKIKVH